MERVFRPFSEMVSWGLIACILTVAVIPKVIAQECAVNITSLEPGANVRRQTLVEGTARIPAKAHLWVLAVRSHDIVD